MVSGYSDLGIFNNFGASSIFVLQRILHPLLAHPGSLDIMSMTFAAGICDADDPCSVNTAYDPESSFTMSPRSTTLPLYFWFRGSTSEFLKTKIHQWHKMNFSIFIPCFFDHLFFCFWLPPAAVPVFSPVLPIFFPLVPLHLEFFWGLEHRNKHV